MQKGFQKFFTAKKTFALFAVLTAIFGLLVGVLCFVTNTYYFIFAPVMAIVAIFMYRSYSRHQKNLMKGLMGASLLWALSEEAGYLEQVLESNRDYYFAAHGERIGLYVALKSLTVAVFLGIFILHFVINSERKSSPKTIKLNHTLFYVLFALYILDIVFNIQASSFNVSIFLLILFKLCLVIMVLCIESSLDEFRLNREAAGWTEEAGYPEGYVHQKDRS